MTSWLAQRDEIRQELTNVISRAQRMLSSLGDGGMVSSGRKRGRPPVAATGSGKRKRRKMSKQARAKIAAAQRARWAKVKAGK